MINNVSTLFYPTGNVYNTAPAQVPTESTHVTDEMRNALNESRTRLEQEGGWGISNPSHPTSARNILFENDGNDNTRLRSISEMTRLVEDTLNQIDNNANFSESQRTSEREQLENLFANALSMHNNTQQMVSGSQNQIFALNRSNAQSHVENVTNTALGVMQNVESLSSNPQMQELINRGMEEMVASMREQMANNTRTFPFNQPSAPPPIVGVNILA
ncbi:MAG: hypothetical protein FWC16_00110 [Defluviitaleaceae bacterium]|nr:hypothetical protein [Defluviitaleaceae bacterium]MCL2273305.1 hypothetical protein [Defluviitaleaceae bacterium]